MSASAPVAGREPSLEQILDGDEARFNLHGDWVARHTARLERLVAEAPKRALRTIIDLTAVEQLDTFGAWAVESLRRNVVETGAAAAITGADAAQTAIFSQLRQADVTPRSVPRAGVLDLLERCGGGVADGLVYFVSIISLLGQLLVGLGRGLISPRRLRLRSIVHHLDRVGVQAVPIIVLITFLIGSIIAQQGLFYFRKFGASDYVVNFVAVLVLRELGVLLVVIMVAGRSGSSYAAEIGSMKMREEIDALRTMGVDPVELLLLPRVLALVVAAPMLTILGVLAALYGAGLMMWLYGGMSPGVFLARLQAAATYSDFLVGVVKAPVMALVVGLIAAVEGFAVAGSAESLGLRTTASVVKSIFLVIVLDGLFAIIFTSLGL